MLCSQFQAQHPELFRYMSECKFPTKFNETSVAANILVYLSLVSRYHVMSPKCSIQAVQSPHRLDVTVVTAVHWNNVSMLPPYRSRGDRLSNACTSAEADVFTQLKILIIITDFSSSFQDNFFVVKMFF